MIIVTSCYELISVVDASLTSCLQDLISQLRTWTFHENWNCQGRCRWLQLSPGSADYDDLSYTDIRNLMADEFFSLCKSSYNLLQNSFVLGPKLRLSRLGFRKLDLGLVSAMKIRFAYTSYTSWVDWSLITILPVLFCFLLFPAHDSL